MVIENLSCGDKVHRYFTSVVIQFDGSRKVLSTAPINGGYREDLKAVFNTDCKPRVGVPSILKTDGYEEYMNIIANELGLDPLKTAGIATSAYMDNLSIKTSKFKDLTVTALATGGIEVNGGRVGDAADFYEENKVFKEVKIGTINIILFIDADLSESCLARALVTCTEAKTAALQELMAGSNYSTGIATGSGTDGTIIISNSESNLHLTEAGKHSKLGELIGKTVMAAVKESLYLQSGLCEKNQHSILRRVKRYGINEEVLWSKYLEKENSNIIRKSDFIDKLHQIDKDEKLVPLVALLVHLLDELSWGLINDNEAIETSKILLINIKNVLNVDCSLLEEYICGKDFIINNLIHLLCCI